MSRTRADRTTSATSEKTSEPTADVDIGAVIVAMGTGEERRTRPSSCSEMERKKIKRDAQVRLYTYYSTQMEPRESENGAWKLG